MGSVLILIVMEHALGAFHLLDITQTPHVLILIVMEHALGAYARNLYWARLAVLILIVMEHALGASQVAEASVGYLS